MERRSKLIGPTTFYIFTIIVQKLCKCEDVVCDRRPLGIKADPLPPDNQFLIDIDGIREDQYIPSRPYMVRLHSRDEKSTFIAFSLWLRGDSVENRYNPRKPVMLKTGSLERNSTNSKLSSICMGTIIESDITEKTSVEAIWTAPRKDNKCVTILAVVAVKPDVWYSFEGPLSKRVCEDRRKAEDMLPTENDNCRAEEEARYQLTFEGLWSYNTHQDMYPPSQYQAQFSDVVGASHKKGFVLYKYNSEATLGLKMLAEQGNTTQMEIDILEHLSASVRTVIKATAPLKTNMSTVSNFRTTREHHLVSLATGILPSPDWFLGVANLELCNFDTGDWDDYVTLNLYPLDAGTDKGSKFDSPNEETSPHQPITRAIIADIPEEKVKPFAKLHFHLIRTYNTADSDTGTTEASGGDGASDEGDGNEGTDGDEDGDDDGEGDDDGDEGEETQTQAPHRPEYRPPTHESRTHRPPAEPAPTEDCPPVTWRDWDECQGECVDKHLDGYRFRFGYYETENPPEECLPPPSEIQQCSEDCEEETTEEATEE